MPKAESIIILILLVLLSVATFERNLIWGSEVIFWADVAAKSPGKARPYNNLGGALIGAERYDEAMRYLNLSIKQDPWYLESHYNLAIAYIKTGNLDRALPELLEVLKINDVLKRGHFGARAVPRYELQAHSNLGNIYHTKGMFEKAVSHYKEALSINPSDASTRFNLAITYKKTGRFDDAAQEFEEVLRLNPSDEAAKENLLSMRYYKYEENHQE